MASDSVQVWDADFNKEGRSDDERAEFQAEQDYKADGGSRDIPSWASDLPHPFGGTQGDRNTDDDQLRFRE